MRTTRPHSSFLMEPKYSVESVVCPSHRVPNGDREVRARTLTHGPWPKRRVSCVDVGGTPKETRNQVEKKMGTPIDYRPSSIVKAGRRAGGDERKADSTRSQEVSKQKKASAENPKAPKSKKKRQRRRALGASVPSHVVQAHHTPLRCLLSERNEWPGRSDPKKIRAEEIPQTARKRKRKTAATASTRRPQVDVSPPSPDLHRSADDPPKTTPLPSSRLPKSKSKSK
jgi:hypothetical protein